MRAMQDPFNLVPETRPLRLILDQLATYLGIFPYLSNLA